MLRRWDRRVAGAGRRYPVPEIHQISGERPADVLKFKRSVQYSTFDREQALEDLLAAGRTLLIDVRNRTELNDVGQIPGSVCLPLHEVRLAFQLSPQEFEVRSYVAEIRKAVIFNRQFFRPGMVSGSLTPPEKM